MKDLFTSSAGVRYRWNDSRQGEGFFQVVASQDVAPILELNKAMANENAGWNGDKTMRRAATIPSIVRQKIINEQGWDPLDLPANWDRLKRLLNDPDYKHLRTAEWRV